MKQKTYRQAKFPSSKNPNLTYTATIFYGGLLTHPNMTCTCPAFVFQKKFCRHCEALWGELGDFAKMSVIHHDEINAKVWMRKQPMT